MALAGNQPYPIERFGGLRLASDPAEVGFEAATDMLNVDFPVDRSRVFTRAGSQQFSSTLAGPAQALAPVNFGPTLNYMLLSGISTGTTAYLDRITSGGTRAAVGTWAAPNSGDFAPQIATLGTPTTSLAFIAWSRTQLRKYDGTTLGTSVGSPAFVAVTPQSNRLVQAWFSAAADSPTGANGTKSTVFFSDAGAPETYSANNYVHLHPGDGEQITGVVVWRELVFVFKESRAFVFYGESTDATGNPVFNFRQITLDNPVDQSISPFNRVVATNLGVYFMATDGVYRTTGGQPTKVSAAIDGALAVGELHLHLSAFGDRVSFQVLNRGHYVLDERSGEWTYWALIGASATTSPIVTWSKAFPERRAFFYTLSTALYRTSASFTGDGPTIIESRYRTGFADMASVAQKVIRETQLDGTGTVNVGYAVDWGTNPTGTSVALGISPDVAQGRSRTSVKGRNFRLQIDASLGYWSVSRVTPLVRSVRGVGEGSR